LGRRVGRAVATGAGAAVGRDVGRDVGFGVPFAVRRGVVPGVAPVPGVASVPGVSEVDVDDGSPDGPADGDRKSDAPGVSAPWLPDGPGDIPPTVASAPVVAPADGGWFGALPHPASRNRTVTTTGISRNVGVTNRDLRARDTTAGYRRTPATDAREAVISHLASQIPLRRMGDNAAEAIDVASFDPQSAASVTGAAAPGGRR